MKKGKTEASEQETDSDTLTNEAAPVQPVGYGATEGADPAEVVAERDAVQRTMAHLSEPLRECLLLSILGDFSTAEIATMLDLQEAAVRQRLARARKQFQQFYALESGEQVSDSSAPFSSIEKQVERGQPPHHKGQISKQKKGEEGLKSVVKPEERYFSMHNA